MRITYNFWFYIVAIFFVIAISIGSSENLKLRELIKNSENDQKNSATETGKTKVRFPFRKLEKTVDSSTDNDDLNDDDDEDDKETDENGDDKSNDFTFTKVHKPTYEVKKRSNFRFSKISKIIHDEENDNDKDVDDEENDDEKITLFQRVKNFFMGESKKEEEKSEIDEDESEDDDDDDENDEETAVADIAVDDKSLFNEVIDIVKDFWETKTKIEHSRLDEDTDDEDEDDNNNDDENDDNEEKVKYEANLNSNKIRISIKEIIGKVFNRSPFNFLINFDEPFDTAYVEDSEEDDKKYQELLKEERDQMKRKVDRLTSAEENVRSAELIEGDEKIDKTTSKVSKSKRSKDEVQLSQKEFEKLLLNLPSFVPDYSKIKNSECARQGDVFQRQLRGKRIWALQMMDATAKIPSGLLRGNTNQLGDFDLCTKISQKIRISESNTMKLKGKYCLANIDMVASVDELKLPVHLIQGRNFIRSTINDV